MNVYIAACEGDRVVAKRGVKPEWRWISDAKPARLDIAELEQWHFVTHYDEESREAFDVYAVTNVETGLRVPHSEARTRSEAVKKAQASIAKVGAEKVAKIITRAQAWGFNAPADDTNEAA